MTSKVHNVCILASFEKSSFKIGFDIVQKQSFVSNFNLFNGKAYYEYVIIAIAWSKESDQVSLPGTDHRIKLGASHLFWSDDLHHDIIKPFRSSCFNVTISYKFAYPCCDFHLFNMKSLSSKINESTVVSRLILLWWYWMEDHTYQSNKFFVRMSRK